MLRLPKKSGRRLTKQAGSRDRERLSRGLAVSTPFPPNQLPFFSFVAFSMFRMSQTHLLSLDLKNLFKGCVNVPLLEIILFSELGLFSLLGQ